MGVAPSPKAQLYPTPRVSNGLSDAYTDILGGEPLQSNMSGNNTSLNAGGISAVLTVESGGATGKQVVIPANWFGGNVTWVRGLYATSAVPRYQDFMADFTGSDTSNYADTTQAAVNLYASGVLSTTVPVLASVAVGTQLQAYYSYRDGTFSVKGQSMEGYPQLHVDPYQGTANDGDDYLMVSWYHAYLTSGDEKFKKLADRIGNALLDAGRWDSNHVQFNIPFSDEAGQVGYYDYWASTTPYAVANTPSGLQITTTVNSGGPPYNDAGFGLWPTINIPAGATFSSLAITMTGDGSGRSILVNLNTDPAKSSAGDYWRMIPMLPTDQYASILFTLLQSDFWKVGNVIYDSQHQDFSYSGTYGSDVSTLNPDADFINKVVRQRFYFDFTGNSSGYAGLYFGAASDSSAGTTALSCKIYADQEGIIQITAKDSAGVDHALMLHLNAGWNTFNIPWIGTLDAAVSTVTNWTADETTFFGSAQNAYDVGVKPYYPEWCSIFITPEVAGFSQTTFSHPVTEFYIDAVSYVDASYYLYWLLVGAQVPIDSAEFVLYASYNVRANFATRNAIELDEWVYDSVNTMDGTNPSVLNGVQISFPSNSLGTPYKVTFEEIDFNITVQDGPTSDPQRYMGIPRWTYKWTDSLGYIGYGAWRGPSGVGYSWMAGWYHSGIINPDNNRKVSDMMLDFMADAQDQYATWWPTKLKGPFVPRYGRPSWEAITTSGYVAGTMQSSTYNAWYYPDTDDWYGYTYRALLSCAQLYYYSRLPQVKAILDNWMAWLDANIVASGSYWAPPSDFYQDGTVGYTYQPVYAFACIAAACIYKYWVDGDAIAFKWYRRMLDSMFANDRQTATGTLAGIYPTSEGEFYTAATVVFTVNAGATAPTATAYISGGKITHYDITSAGSGITSISCQIDGDGIGAAGNPYLSDDLVGAFSTSHAGWEAAEILNTYGMLINGERPGGSVSYPITPTADDLTAWDGLIAFYQRTSRDARPSMQTADWIPLHEYRVDPYHNGSAIENPMISDTHAKGAMWTETIAPTVFAAVEYARSSGDWTWVDTLYALCIEFTGNIQDATMQTFPTLDGLEWNVKTSPEFSTITQRAASGYEARSALMQFPLWNFSMSYSILRDDTAHDELKTLVGFFLQMQGSFSAFLYSNPNDNAVVDQGFGTGDGATTAFQLIRSYGGFVETVQNLNGSPVVKIGGVELPVSIAAPSTPSLSQTSGGTLSAATYYARITYVDLNGGETPASAESSLAVSANNLLTVTSPGATQGAVGYNVYVSTSTDTETMQNASPIAIGTDWTEPTTGLVSGTAYPSANTTGYSLSSTGLVTFGNAPALGAAITWTGNFYYRVRFSADKADFNQFMYQLFELKQLQFVGSPINKV